MTKNKSVFGIYRGNVEPAVNALKHAGFSNSDVSILLPENIDTEELLLAEPRPDRELILHRASE